MLHYALAIFYSKKNSSGILFSLSFYGLRYSVSQTTGVKSLHKPLENTDKTTGKIYYVEYIQSSSMNLKYSYIHNVYTSFF